MKGPKLFLQQRLPVSPLSLTCPYCKAKRGKACTKSRGGLEAVHVERIEMAALADKMGELREKATRRRKRGKD